ncbi:MAG TPA: sigma 54-interacting transcriptional regulator, partial [Minicystis sp.]|nr:sigma 54-interacting transcriptional regulator [Minicystis sp.]
MRGERAPRARAHVEYAARRERGALERREVTPVGATRPKKLDVRVVSATLRDLRQMVNARAFREDLYFRLAQARARMPSLAERPGDVRPLVQHVLGAIPWDVQAARAIDKGALDALAARPFRG